MSDRIDGLLEEALKKLDHPVKTTLTDDQLIELKTVFAHLIIEECARVADDNFDSGFCPVGDLIKNHFNRLTMMMVTL